MRLGPVCEAIINGRYYWVPFDRLSRIDLEAPVDLRDVVWMPAHFQFANGGEIGRPDSDPLPGIGIERRRPGAPGPKDRLARASA